MFQDTHLIQGEDYKGSAPRAFNNYSQKFRVHSAECGIPTAFTNPDVVEALFAFQGLSVDVPELGASHNAERHLKNAPIHKKPSR